MGDWSPLHPLVLAIAAAACGNESASRPPERTPPSKPDSVAGPAAKPDAGTEAPNPRVVTDETSARAIASKRAEVLQDPAFRDATFQSALVEPFVVFQEVNKQDVRDTIRKYDDRDGAMKEIPVEGTTNPAKVEQNIRWAEKADSLAKRSATLLAELDRRFRELFSARFDLTPLEEKGRRPTVVLFWSLPHYGKTGLARPNGYSAGRLQSVHDPKSHCVVSYLGDEFLMSEDEIVCADGRVQKVGDQSLLADGAEQLLREYAAIRRGRPLVDGEEEATPPAPEWFVSGFADWLGAFEVPRDRLESPAGADVLHERIRLDFVADSRRNRSLAEKWTLTQLMKPLHSGDRAALGERLVPGELSTMTSLFRARAWAFCHFLWNYDAGKYRAQFTDLVGLFLAGEASSHKFAVEIMKRPSIADWGDVEFEFEWYWTQLLERRVGRTAVTHAWATPGTSPPEGKAEQDADFVAYWKDAHGK